MNVFLKFFIPLLVLFFSNGMLFARPQENKGDFPIIEINDVKNAVNDKTCLIIDARPSVFYELGHIENAISLPVIDFETAYPVLKKKTDIAKFSRLILYCTDKNCEDSTLLAKKLNKLGIKNIYIYKAGWQEWKKGGNES